MYRVPSTPTVIFRESSPRFSRILSTTAAIPAPHSWAARRAITVHTSFTMMLSSQVLSSPRCWRMERTWRRARRSLEGSREREKVGRGRGRRFLTASPGWTEGGPVAPAVEQEGAPQFQAPEARRRCAEALNQVKTEPFLPGPPKTSGGACRVPLHA